MFILSVFLYFSATAVDKKIIQFDNKNTRKSFIRTVVFYIKHLISSYDEKNKLYNFVRATLSSATLVASSYEIDYESPLLGTWLSRKKLNYALAIDLPLQSRGRHTHCVL